MPLKGSKLAYYLKKRDPELYEKARRVKELYNLTWDAAIAIARGKQPPPPPSKLEELINSIEGIRARVDAVESSLKKLSDLELRVRGLEKRVEVLEGILNELNIGLSRRFRLEYRCVHMDSEGYCIQWFWRERVEGFEVKKAGEERYIVNVLKHK